MIQLPQDLPSAMTLAGIVFYATLYTFSAYNCYRIFVSGQNPASTLAWILFHILMPLAAVPFYIVFGRRKLTRYPNSRKSRRRHAQQPPDPAVIATAPPETQPTLRALQNLTPFTRFGFNRVSLLIDGDQTFDAMFRSIQEARHFILVQFYILRSDRIGRELRNLLVAKAEAGVTVHVLYDGFGSFWLSTKFIRTLKAADIEIARFMPATQLNKMNLINFRNHRKLVIIDGHTAFTGGLNVGEEYLGGGRRYRKKLYWRDTHLKIEGQAAAELCETFFADWKFTTGRGLPIIKDRLQLMRSSADAHSGTAATATPTSAGRRVLSKTIPTGPADAVQSAKLVFLQLICQAKRRLWIATPYFVPSEVLSDALELAVLRGVDVRFLVPRVADHLLVAWATRWMAYRLSRQGVRFMFYDKGFMHQKVTLVDDDLAMVGSSNFDQRAELNFETNLVVVNPDFAREVEAMLSRDFADSRPLSEVLPIHSRVIQRLCGQFARFFAPQL